MTSRALLAPPSLVQPNTRLAVSPAQPLLFPSQAINENNVSMMPVPMSAHHGAASPLAYPTVFPLSIPSIVNDQMSVMQPHLMAGPSMSNATVVSNAPSSASSAMTAAESLPAPPPSVIIANASSSSPPAAKRPKNHVHTDRRHALPSSILLPHSSDLKDAITHPVPEFLCHLFTMLTDPQLDDIISWSVPTENETNDQGGGFEGIGKIVVHMPGRLQNEVLGRFYRHSCYASFQRQLNYFGFKKRLHGGKKGKLSPCSYVHEGVGDEPTSLFQLKRRPPKTKKMTAEGSEADRVSVVSVSTSSSSSSSSVRVQVQNRVPEKKKNALPKKAKKVYEDDVAAKSAKKPRTTKDTKQTTKKGKGREVSFDIDGSFAASSNMKKAIDQAINEDSLFANSNFFNNSNIVIPPNMPLMAHAEGIAPPPSCASKHPSSMNDLLAANTLVPNMNGLPTNYKCDIDATRANAAVREAQKSLERAYRKSKREHEEKDQATGLIVPPPMKVQNNDVNVPWAGALVPNPLVAPPPMAPMWNNLNYSFAYNANVAMGGNNNSTLNFQQFQQQPPAGQQQQQQQQQQYQQHPNNLNLPEMREDATSPIEFDDVFSKLLSTTLPPSEELFGDELSTGSLAEEDFFDESGLQVVDDGMLLP